MLSDVDRIQRGKYVAEVGRYSTPPQLDDLRGLTFKGLFGGRVRHLVERRVKAEAPYVLNDLRRRLEAPERILRAPG
jgi:hypothetical protein